MFSFKPTVDGLNSVIKCSCLEIYHHYMEKYKIELECSETMIWVKNKNCNMWFILHMHYTLCIHLLYHIGNWS